MNVKEDRSISIGGLFEGSLLHEIKSDIENIKTAKKYKCFFIQPKVDTKLIKLQ